MRTESEKQAEFKKLHKMSDCTCTIVDYDWPNPTLRFSKSCPHHFSRTVVEESQKTERRPRDE